MAVHPPSRECMRQQLRWLPFFVTSAALHRAAPRPPPCTAAPLTACFCTALLPTHIVPKKVGSACAQALGALLQPLPAMYRQPLGGCLPPRSPRSLFPPALSPRSPSHTNHPPACPHSYYGASKLHGSDLVEMFPPGRLIFLRPFKGSKTREAVWDAVWMDAHGGLAGEREGGADLGLARHAGGGFGCIAPSRLAAQGETGAEKGGVADLASQGWPLADPQHNRPVLLGARSPRCSAHVRGHPPLWLHDPAPPPGAPTCTCPAARPGFCAAGCLRCTAMQTLTLGNR